MGALVARIARKAKAGVTISRLKDGRSRCTDAWSCAIMARMNRAEPVAKLRCHADAIKAMGATSLYLFGSVAEDAADTSSDLDLFIDYDVTGRFNAFDLVGIKQFLEGALGIDVDLTTRDGLHPMLRRDIERSSIRVF
jgi:predicted nucleotidyltransferase